jgi:hypothetical protein
VHSSVPDVYAQHTHEGQSICISLQIFKIIFILPKKQKYKKSLMTQTDGLKNYPKFFLAKLNKNLFLKLG